MQKYNHGDIFSLPQFSVLNLQELRMPLKSWLECFLKGKLREQGQETFSSGISTEVHIQDNHIIFATFRNNLPVFSIISLILCFWPFIPQITHHISQSSIFNDLGTTLTSYTSARPFGTVMGILLGWYAGNRCASRFTDFLFGYYMEVYESEKKSKIIPTSFLDFFVSSVFHLAGLWFLVTMVEMFPQMGLDDVVTASSLLFPLSAILTFCVLSCCNILFEISRSMITKLTPAPVIPKNINISPELLLDFHTHIIKKVNQIFCERLSEKITLARQLPYYSDEISTFLEKLKNNANTYFAQYGAVPSHSILLNEILIQEPWASAERFLEKLISETEIPDNIYKEQYSNYPVPVPADLINIPVTSYEYWMPFINQNNSLWFTWGPIPLFFILSPWFDPGVIAAFSLFFLTLLFCFICSSRISKKVGVTDKQLTIRNRSSKQSTWYGAQLYWEQTTSSSRTGEDIRHITVSCKDRTLFSFQVNTTNSSLKSWLKKNAVKAE